MREIESIIQEFRSLDLSSLPVKEIGRLFDEVGYIGHIVVSLYPGFSIMRARPNRKDPRFTKKEQLSFKPPHLNTTYQRASTPEQTMFYASLLPEKLFPGELETVRLVCFAEAMQHLMDKTICAHEKMTFSKWEVIKEIRLLSIIHERSFYNQSNYTRELVNAYDEFIKSGDPEFIKRSLMFSEYLSSEFSKDVIKNHSDYIISALFSQMVTKKGLDGVLYPSVRALGQGFNIAITPDAVKNLQLKVVGECTVYKRKDQTIVGNDAYALLNGNESNFNLIDLPSNESAYLRELGLKSIKDLKECR